MILKVNNISKVVVYRFWRHETTYCVHALANEIDDVTDGSNYKHV